MFNRIGVLFSIVCIVLMGFAVGISAISAQESSPTPAPTKTSTPIVAVTSTDVPTVITSDEVFQPFTQSDLIRLTANVQRPNGIYWFDDKLYTACTGDSTVYEIDDTSGQTRTYIFGIRNAHMLYVEDNETSGLTLWVPDYSANTMATVTRAGVRTIARDLQGPWGIAWVDEAQFLVTNLLGNTLNIISRDGDNETVLADLSAPAGIVIDGDRFYVANAGSTRRSIEWYPLAEVMDGGYQRETPQSQILVSGLQNVTGMQMAPSGDLYFTFALGTRGVVGRIDPEDCYAQGGCTNEDVEIVLFSDLTAPLAGLVITPDSRLFVHEMFSPDLYWVALEQ